MRKNYLKYVIKQINLLKNNNKSAINTTLNEQKETEHTTEKKHVLVLPYQGKKGVFIIKLMKKRFKNLLPQCIVPVVVFTVSKLISKLQVKDRTIFSHNNAVIYLGNCLEDGCPDNYV